MLNLKSFLLFFLITLGLSTNAHPPLAQSSYIVTKTNDTIYGKIKVNIFTSSLKLVTADSTYHVDPNIYTAYYDAKHKATYRSKVLPSLIPEKLAKKMSITPKADWLKCVEDGRITLYELNSYLYGHTPDNALGIATTFSSIIATGGIPNAKFTNWYIEKDGVQLVPIKYNSFASTGSKTRKERIALLQDMLADKMPEQHYKNKSFTFKSVRTLVRLYNDLKS